MKATKRIFLGLLLLIVMSVVTTGLLAAYMVSLGPPEQHREVTSQTQEVFMVRLVEATDPTVDETAVSESVVRSRSLQVELDLQEGEFQILPGEPGEGIRIEADYDSGIYALEQNYDSGEDETGAEKVTIRFYSKYSLMRRLLTLGGEIDVDNRINIYLPPDIPMRLSGGIRMGESHLNLSGLPLTGVALKLTMGEHEVEFNEPNPVQMEELQIYASKGEFNANGLGNAGFQNATIVGSMGELNVDLRGAYSRDANVRTRFRMGELDITVPKDVHVNVASSKVMLGEQRSSVESAEDLPEGTPSLNLEAAMSMGELTIRSQ